MKQLEIDLKNAWFEDGPMPIVNEPYSDSYVLTEVSELGCVLILEDLCRMSVLVSFLVRDISHSIRVNYVNVLCSRAVIQRMASVRALDCSKCGIIWTSVCYEFVCCV